MGRGIVRTTHCKSDSNCYTDSRHNDKANDTTKADNDMSKKADKLFADVTAKLIADMATANPDEWVAPWNRSTGGLPIQAQSRRPYKGFNAMLLMMSNPEGASEWATYKTWQALGSQVRKGSESVSLIKWGKFQAKTGKLDDAGDEIKRTQMFANTFNVFHWSQCDHETYEPPAPPEPTDTVIDERVAAFVAG